MSAITDWKTGYYLWTHGDLLTGSRMMNQSRREAALERKLEAENKRIEELQDRVWQLEAKTPNYDDGMRFSDSDASMLEQWHDRM